MLKISVAPRPLCEPVSALMHWSPLLTALSPTQHALPSLQFSSLLAVLSSSQYLPLLSSPLLLTALSPPSSSFSPSVHSPLLAVLSPPCHALLLTVFAPSHSLTPCSKKIILRKNEGNWDIWNQSQRYFLLEIYHQYRYCVFERSFVCHT